MSVKTYDQPLVVTHVISDVDFGAGDSAYAIKAPYGYSRARLFDVGVLVTETFTNTTTAGFVRIGTAADADAYAELAMATAAATNYYNTVDDTDAIINADIPTASTQLEVACIAPTGGTPAGIGDVHIVIGYY
jgi:hypothetical protein